MFSNLGCYIMFAYMVTQTATNAQTTPIAPSVQNSSFTLLFYICSYMLMATVYLLLPLVCNNAYGAHGMHVSSNNSHEAHGRHVSNNTPIEINVPTTVAVNGSQLQLNSLRLMFSNDENFNIGCSVFLANLVKFTFDVTTLKE
jgi:hypothetical protein